MGYAWAMQNFKCENCGSNSTWYEDVEGEVFALCVCGMRKPVATRYGGCLIVRKPIEYSATMPRSGTKLGRCLDCVANADSISTQHVSTSTGIDSRTVSAMLTLLAQRGLIRRIESRRGKPGGSLWETSDPSKAGESEWH